MGAHGELNPVRGPQAVGVGLLHTQALDPGVELTHVPGPAVTQHQEHEAAVDVEGPTGVEAHKVPGEERDVFRALTKRGHMQRPAQAPEEILTKLALGDEHGEVAVGGGDKTNVGFVHLA